MNRVKRIRGMVGLFVASVCWPMLVNAQDNTPTATLSDTPTAAVEMEEFVVIGNRSRQQMDLQTKQLVGIAGAGLDPLLSIYALPGVAQGPDNLPIFRGSASTDNSYYIEQIPAPNLYHIFGNSIVDKDLLHSFDIYPSAYPNGYSDATGGVIDVTLRDPIIQPVRTAVHANFFITGVRVEGRGPQEDSAFFLNVRRSLVDIIVAQFIDDDEELSDGITVQRLPTAHDYQAKYRWDLSNRQSITALATGSLDSVGVTFNEGSDPVLRDPDLEGRVALDVVYHSQGVVWHYDGPSNLDISLRFNRYQDENKQRYGNAGQRENVLSERWLLRGDIYYQLGAHQIKMGFSRERRNYEIDLRAKLSSCTEFNPDERCYDSDLPLTNVMQDLSLFVDNIFIEDDFFFGRGHIATVGVHYSHDDYSYNARLEPRLKLDFSLTKGYHLQLNWGYYSQLPLLYQWLPSSGNPDLNKSKARHLSIAFAKDWVSWSFKLEYYYKDLNDLAIGPYEGLLYANLATGVSSGIEFLLKKKLTNRWYGWVAATLNDAERTNLIDQSRAPFGFEQPLQLDVVFNYQQPLNNNRQLDYSLVWNYQSGTLYTPVVRLDEFTDPQLYYLPVYGELNSYRLPPNHRLDLQFRFTQQRKHGKYYGFYIDIYNALNRENVLDYTYTTPEDGALPGGAPGFGEDVPVATEVSLGIIPSIGFEYIF